MRVNDKLNGTPKQKSDSFKIKYLVFLFYYKTIMHKEYH